MRIVNGYVCMTSCDEAVARRNIDPKNPHDDPVKAAQLAEKKGVVAETTAVPTVEPAFRLDGLLATARKPGDPTAAGIPLRLVDVTA
jgi:hypothetical protein